MTTETTRNPVEQNRTMTSDDLREAGFSPREIHRLEVFRDCLGCYPHIEFFGSREWKQLLFLKWRIEHGEYAKQPSG